MRVTYRTIEALAGSGQIAYGTNWTVAQDHPLAGGETGAPVLIALTAGGVPVPWSALRFGSLPPGVAAPDPPGAGQVVLDVARGQVELGPGLAGPVRATWHRPLAGGLGALASVAEVSPGARVVVVVNPAKAAGGNVVHTLKDAFALAKTMSAALSATASRPGIPDVEIRLETSDRLAAPPAQSFTPSAPRWRLLASRPMTPTVVGTLSLDLAGACVELAGFYLDGHLELGASLQGASLAFVTMNTADKRELRVAAGAWGLALVVERSVVGAIRADLGALPIVSHDSVVDSRGSRLRVCGGNPGGSAKAAVSSRTTFDPALRTAGTTFSGAVRVESVDGTDSLFLGGISALQRQDGCLRHCYLGPDLETPPAHPMTYRCGPFPAPTFASVGFDAGGYYALALEPDHPLLSAASDGGEIGAYHHARRALRVARLRRRLPEYVPLGLRSGLTLASWEE